ncbi:iron-containing alcohol dehydrogenase [Alkaliphilus metalliredigens QYMF]|uniref:Iron-containing alcohol dehydrogenase n=1 Tax=Alkaliphilus metalliredigens (strain QYMF) TaxID=293826 RepID=A6TJY4_ALKMQ|nr:1-propanol dehydrogenase PduQ [Alkaliphilus metalliredigens]ABR46502.1 iron-containing alcohol dehydrogenase [Alkaliphilus metalliredigens QYMF]
MKNFKEMTEIVHGIDAIQYLERFKNKRACIVTDPTMVQLKVVDRVTEIFDRNKIDYDVFSEVEPDPSFGVVYKGLNHIIKNKPELLIAVGGGSAIDAAKAIMYFCIKIKESLLDTQEIPKPFFIAIPTTSGTGSEVTAYSVITDKEKNIKIPIIDSLMVPDVAILDPIFTKTIPSHVTADTGIDVLTHCVEAYVSKDASDFTDALVEKATVQVFRYLPVAYKDGSNMEAREKLHNASCMAGIAFTNAGLGINHSMAHSLGSHFKMSHGRSNAILMPYIIAFNSKGQDKTGYNPAAVKYAELAKYIGLPNSTVETGVLGLIEAIKVMKIAMGIPATIKEAGVDRESFMNSLDEISAMALEDICTSSNPKKVSKEDIKNIYLEAYDRNSGLSF